MNLPSAPDAVLPLFLELAQLDDPTSLATALVDGICRLSRLDLVQYYRLDATHTQLVRLAQSLDGTAALTSEALPLEQESLLQYCLTQNRSLHLRELVKNIPANRLMIETDAPYLVVRLDEPQRDGGRG